MKRIRNGDQTALRMLYDQYGGAVYSVAYRVLGDHPRSEEITQDVFLRVWGNADLWQARKGKLSSWLMTIARNAAIDRVRKDQRRVDVASTPVDDMPERYIEEQDISRHLWQNGRTLRALIAQLPPEQAEPIELAFFGGMTHQDIADTQAIPLGTVKTRIRLGLQKLRAMWEDSQDD